MWRERELRLLSKSLGISGRKNDEYNNLFHEYLDDFSYNVATFYRLHFPIDNVFNNIVLCVPHPNNFFFFFCETRVSATQLDSHTVLIDVEGVSVNLVR